MFPKILPGLIGKIEFLPSETEKISEGADFLGNIQNSVFVSLPLSLRGFQVTSWKHESGVQEEDPLKGYNDSHGYIDDVSSNEIIKRVIIGRKRRQPNSEHCIPPMLKD